MHKFFAKTLFLGKNVVFLPECHSTNELAKELADKHQLKDGSIVWSEFQSKGKGQQGNVWLSEPNKNLLFTIYLKPDNLPVMNQFKLTQWVSVAISEVLSDLLPRKVEIKWPNDIYCDDQKIAGILIETVVAGTRIEEVFCGVGLNVNQSHFSLPTATSCHLNSGKEHDRIDLLEDVLISMEKYIEGLYQGDQLKARYLSKLRWLNEIHEFSDNSGLFKGEIKGTNQVGKIELIKNDELVYYDNKEIQFIE